MPEKNTEYEILDQRLSYHMIMVAGLMGIFFFEIQVTSSLVTGSNATWICISRYCHGLYFINCKNNQLFRWRDLRDSGINSLLKNVKPHHLAGILPKIAEELSVKMNIYLGDLTHSAVS